MNEQIEVLPSMKIKYLPGDAVVVVESMNPLDAADFGKLKLAIDPWVESHGELRGLVARAPRLSALGELRSMIQHIRFAQMHHPKIERVAYVTNQRSPKILSKFAEGAIGFELKTFDECDLSQAVQWAANRERSLASAEKKKFKQNPLPEVPGF